MKKTNGKVPLKLGTRVRILDTPHNTSSQFGTIEEEIEGGYAVAIDIDIGTKEEPKSSTIWAKKVEVVG